MADKATTSSATILVIDDDAEIRYSLHRVLASRHYNVISAASGREGLEMAEKEKPHLIFLDNRMDGMTGIETLQHLRALGGPFMVILMTAFGTTQTAIEAMKFGAFDYIVKPFDTKKVLNLAQKALNELREISAAQNDYRPLLNSEDYKEGIVGSSEAMREVFKIIGQVAASDVTVLITGESGTGKELIAHCLHRHSLRADDKPFLAVNCAAIPEDLIESELFGHEKGSFTGAAQRRTGKFELCHEGTVFLDEIGDMSLSTQTKILRVLQGGEIQRVGGSETIKVDVRLIAATNKDLEKMVEEKTFREDLYYRLNVVRIAMPPLRERLDDIPEIVDFFLQRLSKQKKTGVRHVSQDGLEILKHYAWPGNVRELENVIQRSAAIAQGEAILAKDLPREIRESAKRYGVKPESATEPWAAETPWAASNEDAAGDLALHAVSLDEAFDLLYKSIRKESGKAILEKIEREIIHRALKETGGNQAQAAALLGITRATLRKRIEQYSLRL